VLSPLPNPLVTWGGVAAMLLLLWVVARALWRARRAHTLVPLGSPMLWAAAFVLTGYLSGWLPWVLTLGRSAVFQFYAVVLTPFSALALALVLAALCTADGGPLMRLAGLRLDASAASVQGRRIAVAVFVLAALVLAVLFFPLWSGMPVADWFYRAHLWLPGWR
jgi:dolichyl-phosphate-mannose--protein O-mannosyl transferase